jgi:hypothetical protein
VERGWKPEGGCARGCKWVKDGAGGNAGYRKSYPILAINVVH